MKSLKIISLSVLSFLLITCRKDNEESTLDTTCSIDNSISQERLNCSETLIQSNEYTETVLAGSRIITVNHIPDHKVGPFPNERNPNIIKPIQEVLTINSDPQKATELTVLQNNNGPQYVFGIALNGVEFDPVAAEPWGKGTTNTNWEWNLEAMNNDLGFDCNMAHVQPTGEYHYHGVPELYLEALGADGSDMVMAGWAADGFPIYYKFAYEDENDENSAVISMTTSYQLKSGNRPGDGVSAPCAEYNGKYVNDYEYVSGLGLLDECNGREGVTPEFPGGTYYYMITEEFPGIPRCLVGTPSSSFKLGPP